MRGNSDRSETYPYSPAPANGWGHDNPTGEYVVGHAAHIGKAVRIEEDGSHAAVPFSEATRFPGAPEAAIAAGKLAASLH